MIAVFDAMGTLFDLSVLDEPLSNAGVPSRDAWFQRLLHSAQTSTITDAYKPFRELAESTLRTVTAQQGDDPGQAGEIAGRLASVPAHPDAAEALDRLAAADVPAVVLTNSAIEQTEELLRQSGLGGGVRRVFSTDEVQAFKPDPRPYNYAREELGVAAAELTLIAAHGWDVVGARAVGWDGIWVERMEREWPFPGPVPARRAAGLAEAAAILA